MIEATEQPELILLNKYLIIIVENIPSALWTSDTTFEL